MSYVIVEKLHHFDICNICDIRKECHDLNIAYIGGLLYKSHWGGKFNFCAFLIMKSVARWSNGWFVGLRVRGFFPRGFDPRTRNEKYLWDAPCLLPTRRRSEVGGAEPEIWRSTSQKRIITLQTPNDER